jgi:hypothetical protein
MSQKSSVPQAAKSVSQALMADKTKHNPKTSLAASKESRIN